MMGLILQSRGLELTAAAFAALWAGIVLWKSIDYIVTVKRMKRERRQELDIDPDA